MSVERVDVVDAEDHVVGTVARADLAASGSNFRVVHVLLLDARGRLVVQRVAPGKARGFVYGSSVAGHVQAGESYEAAARREFEEELGVPPREIRPVGSTWLDEGGRRKFIGVFLARADGPFRPDSSEVESLEAMPVAEVRQRLRAPASGFSATFERVFRFVDGRDAWIA